MQHQAIMQHQGNIIARSKTGIWAEFGESNCHGCHSSCKQASRRIFIAAEYICSQQRGFLPENRGQMLLNVPNSILGRMVFKAFILPLLGFVTGAIVGNLLVLTDAYVFASAASGLLVMIGFSRALPITAEIEVTTGQAV